LNNVDTLHALTKPTGALYAHFTPLGHLRLVRDFGTPNLTAAVHERLIAAFASGNGHGLLQLGAGEIATVLPPELAWLREFATLYVTALCATGEGAEILVPEPSGDALEVMIGSAPPIAGSEYLTTKTLIAIWAEIDAALRVELASSELTLQGFLNSRHPSWNLVGRVHFNLAENRSDVEAPFAFLATYTPRLSAQGKAQHLPLKRALAEYSDAKSKPHLLSLLLPVQRAAEQCEWLREMVESGEIYHPLRWTPADAWRFLKDFQPLESAGILVRAPGHWQGGRPARPQIKSVIGTRPPSALGMDALLDFKMELTLDGERLSSAEIKALLKSVEGLQLIRGRWVEVDHKKLVTLLERFETIERSAGENGLPFAQAMRLMAGASLDNPVATDDADWAQLSAGPWLAEILNSLRQPEGLALVDPGADLNAVLRPYQQAGVRWLYLLTRLGLGACLADDMGLGKTIQVLSLLLVLKRERQGATRLRPSLLVAPASLLANWATEAARFAPGLSLLVAHPSAMPAAQLRALDKTGLENIDLVITSYGTLLRLPVAETMSWRIAVLDEAQAIKNPNSKQTKQVKKISADVRIALTGTPVENRLSDLWSIFDFTHPGLLGSDKTFASFTKRLAERENFGPLRALVRPYILRRMKTDKRVISDLPDKSEIKAFCYLKPTQAALYQRAVKDLANALEDAEGIGRKGIVLSYLMRFKQICNHSSQWLGDGAWREQDSGKFSRLRELAEVICAKQEKVLVFTQFRETTEPLAAFLGAIFGQEGLVLHGGTPVAKRRALVQRFQEDELTPFFVLSLKAGGSGLNLTAASHVIHFDRWWNPSVENQATDRAFRIGQQKNVLVHKFVCRGTIEDRIDQLIESKQKLVQDVLEGGAELLLTEMSDKDLLDLVKLDIHSAQEN
jgi:SNF2-related domain/SNF2 Helicase protein/Helicase conserved C-terminal domain